MRMKKKGTQGLTLMELTMVLAILAIIAMILVPTFLNSTDRARLRSDTVSARAVQNAMELYRAERGRNVQGGSMAVILENLESSGHLAARDTDIQTEGAVWVINAQRQVLVDISASPDEVHRAYASLPDTERQFVTGGRR